MRIEQVSVFLENRSGSLAEVSSVLSEAGLQIITLTLSDTSDYGVMRMIISDPEKATATLKAQGFATRSTEVMVLEAGKNPAGLHHMLVLLSNSEINVEYMYAFIERGTGKILVVVRFDRMEDAAEILEKNGFAPIDQKQLRSLA
jgi:hypothetical protein